MERESFRRDTNFNYREELGERIDPFFVALVVRMQINEIIKRYEHQRYVEMMNI